MKVGRIKDPLYKDSYLGITPPTFILPFEAPDKATSNPTCCHDPPSRQKMFTARGVPNALTYTADDINPALP